jgi:hypothetical protein
MVLGELTTDPHAVLTNDGLVRFLRDHPPLSPALDVQALDRVLDTLPHLHELHMKVYVMNRTETLDYAGGPDIGRHKRPSGTPP